jgi:hydroxymethylpyrimidine pyrophosphatase-like HAD family hydrolase
MLDKSDVGVVMGNAEEPIKMIGDFVTDTNDKDGILKAISKIYKRQV